MATRVSVPDPRRISGVPLLSSDDEEPGSAENRGFLGESTVVRCQGMQRSASELELPLSPSQLRGHVSCVTISKGCPAHRSLPMVKGGGGESVRSSSSTSSDRLARSHTVHECSVRTHAHPRPRVRIAGANVLSVCVNDEDERSSEGSGSSGGGSSPRSHIQTQCQPLDLLQPLNQVRVVTHHAEVQPSRSTVDTQTEEATVMGTRQPRNNERRDRRRRERRRRRNNNTNADNGGLGRTTRVSENDSSSVPRQTEVGMGMGMGMGLGLQEHHLPDILHSHLPPPYSTLPHTSERSAPPPPPPPFGAPPHVPLLGFGAPPPPPPPPPPPRRLPGWLERHPFPMPGNRRRRCGSPRFGGDMSEEPKSCCGLVVNQAASIRWFIVLIAFVGLCCAVVGTVLGALRATGREHLTVSLLMIGVGIVLITVSGIAWRLTSQEAFTTSCRLMLGLSNPEDLPPGTIGVGAEPGRRFMARLPPAYGRPHHPFAAMLYPEFQYRPPPPSYQASMQEYRLRLLLLDRHHSAPAAMSPPPTYRSNVSGTLRPALTLSRESDLSRPPSYRSRSSSVNPRPNGDLGTGPSDPGHHHSRDPSLSLSLLSHESLFGNPQQSPPSGNVVSIRSICEDEAKLVPGPVGDLDANGRKCKDGNLVTIVQTTDSSQVIGQESVIVTVSGSHQPLSPCQSSPGHTWGEVQVLAHL
ncbi:unnamed protein product [Darwinula stevensoni]|uniref:Uncharacterized protein n=1 Tax=Darwinula stevensoni TaxID=69355 RepID=A0A7R8WZB0_9CRUS|nr:unnamed protein product [Darwinula stevensoni]CAG0879840.1 unnamed protein product [Darwinula stevensoni]